MFILNSFRLFIAGVLIAGFLLPLESIKGQQFNFAQSDAISFYEAGEYEKAIPLFEESLLYEDNEPQIYIYLVLSLIEVSRYEEALQYGNKGIERFSDDIRVYAVTGEAALNQDISEAIDIYQEMRAILLEMPGQAAHGIERSNVEEALATLYEQLGVKHYQSGNLPDAITAFRQASRFSPEKMEIQFNLAFLLFQAGKTEQAVENLEIAIERFPAEESLRLLLIEIKSGGDSTEDVVRITRELHEQFPDNTSYANAYALSLFNNNQPISAIDFLNKMIQKHPQESVFYDKLTEIYQMRRNMAAASDVLKLKMNAFPDDKQVKIQYGQSLWFLEKFEKSFVFFDSLYAKEKYPEAGRFAGNSLVFLEKYEDADIWYQKLVSDWPENTSILSEATLVFIKNDNVLPAFETSSSLANKTYDGFYMMMSAKLAPEPALTNKFLEMAQSTMFAPAANILIARASGNLIRLGNDEIIKLAEDLIILSEQLESSGLQQIQEQTEEIVPDIKPELFSVVTEADFAKNLLLELFDEIVEAFPLSKANEIMEALIDENSHRAFIFYQSAKLNHRAGRFDNALEHLHRANRLGMNTVELHLQMGKSFNASGNSVQAIFSFERVLALNDQNRDAYRFLIDINQKEGKLDSLCDRWLQRFQNNRENALFKDFLIEALQKANRPEEARKL